MDDFLYSSQLSGLGYQIANISSLESGVIVNASVKYEPDTCPKCQSSRVLRFGKRTQVIRDLPIFDKPCAIHIETRRFQCAHCRSTFYQSLPNVDQKHRMTLRLLEKEQKKQEI